MALFVILFYLLLVLVCVKILIVQNTNQIRDEKLNLLIDSVPDRLLIDLNPYAMSLFCSISRGFDGHSMRVIHFWTKWLSPVATGYSLLLLLLLLHTSFPFAFGSAALVCYCLSSLLVFFLFRFVVNVCFMSFEPDICYPPSHSHP